MASSSGTPCSRSWFVKSTSRIEFLISMPMSAMKPMLAVKEMVLPVTSSITRPPKMPSGTTVSTISVDLKLPNSSTRIAKMPNTATMIAVPMPPKASSLDLRFAAQRVVIAARPRHGVQALHHLRRHLRGVEAALDVGVDRDRALAVVALDLRRRLLEVQRRELRERQRRAGQRGNAHLAERIQICPRAHGRAHDDVVLLAARVLERARRNARHGEANGAIELHGGHAEQAGLLRIHREMQVRARHLQRIVHVARAGRVVHELLHPRRQLLDARRDRAR